MAQKNETPALILSLLITLALLGGGLWWLTRSLNLSSIFQPGNSPGNTSTPSQESLAERTSAGERILFPEGATQAKINAATAFQNGDFKQAELELETSLQQQRNDPEALIYLNNARVFSQLNGNEEPYIYSVFHIAVVVPIGSDRNGSLEILRGVAQAQNEINEAGGIQGQPLIVGIYDDNGDPAIAEQIASGIVGFDPVIGVVGHYASDSSLAAGAIYEQGGVVAISPVSTSVKLSNFGDYIFRTVPSDFVAGRALADYMVQELQQQKAVVYFNSQSGYSQSLKAEFTSALSLGGGQVMAEYDLSAPNFSATQSVANAQQLGATTLVLLTNTGQLDRALQVVQSSNGQFTLLGGDDVYTPKTLEVGGGAASGMVVAVPWHILAHLNSPFVATSRQLWGGDVNWRTVTAYDATRALIQAIQQAPTQSREGVQQALRSSSFQTTGATETVRFLPSGDRNQSVQLVTIEPGSRSGYGYDFIPIP